MGVAPGGRYRNTTRVAPPPTATPRNATSAGSTDAARPPTVACHPGMYVSVSTSRPGAPAATSTATSLAVYEEIVTALADDPLPPDGSAVDAPEDSTTA